MSKSRKLLESIFEGYTTTVTPQEAKNKGMFGPIYHGTSQSSRGEIEKNGFKIIIGNAREGKTQNGLLGVEYPIHWLGFGVYFTTVKSIAKRYAFGSVAGMKTYYLDTDKILTINWGSQNTMMKWWKEVGWVAPKDESGRIAATKKMTANLSSQYDAVWYKGKGLRSMLDGDQICVYNLSVIRELDSKSAGKGEIGSKVVAAEDITFGSKTVPAGTKGVLLNRREIEARFLPYHKGNKEFLEIKWAKGGTMWNVYPSQVKFV